MLVVTTAAAGATTFALVRPTDRAVTSAAERFVPGDGASFVYADDAAPPARSVVEHARLHGEFALFNGSSRVGEYLADVLGDEADEDLEVWRANRTDIEAGGGGGTSTVMYLLDDDGIAILADHGSALGFVYDPPLMVVPADHHLGRTWELDGDALPQGLIAYEASGEVVDTSADGCLDVEYSTRYFDRETDADFLTLTGRDTWCEGRGVVRSAATISGNGDPDSFVVAHAELRGDALAAVAAPFETSEPNDAPDPGGEQPAVPGPGWDDAAQWEVHDVEVVSGDPLFGDGLFIGTTSLRPVVVGDDGERLVFVNDTGRDVTAVDVARAPAEPAPTTWRGHPGGGVIAMGASRQLVAVATDDKRVVAYDVDGVRRWHVELGDLSLGEPAVADDQSVAITSLDGTVRVVESDGHVRWVRDMPVEIDVGPLVHDGAVIVSDRDGNLAAFELSTGERRWSAELDSASTLTAAGDLVVLSGGGDLTAVDVRDGDERWSVGSESLVRAVEVTATSVIAVGDAATAFSLDDGSVAWSRGGASNVVTHGDDAIVVFGDRAVLVDQAGDDVVSWDLEPAAVSSSRFLVPTPDGVWIVGDGFATQLLAGESP